MLPSITLFGKTIELYDPINIIAYLSVMIFVCVNLKDYESFCTFPYIADNKLLKKNSKHKSHLGLFSFLEAALVFVLDIIVVSPLNNPLSRLFLGDTSEGYFPIIYFTPVALFLIGVILRVSPFRLLDFAAAADCLLLIIVKISCFCDGCCYGIEMASSPFYNQKNERYELPIQLIEIACAVIMFVILRIVRKKIKRPGVLFPLFILMYCGSRFVSEFWRDDYPGVLGNLNGNHIMCIIGFAVGIVEMLVVIIWGIRITAFFDNRNKAFLESKTVRKKTVHRKRKK